MTVKTVLTNQINSLEEHILRKDITIKDKLDLHIQLHGYLKTYYDYFGTDEFPKQKETAADATVEETPQNHRCSSNPELSANRRGTLSSDPSGYNPDYSHGSTNPKYEN